MAMAYSAEQPLRHALGATYTMECSTLASLAMAGRSSIAYVSNHSCSCRAPLHELVVRWQTLCCIWTDNCAQAAREQDTQRKRM